MEFDLTDAERRALAELKRSIESDRFPLSPRVQWKGILVEVRPERRDAGAAAARDRAEQRRAAESCRRISVSALVVDSLPRL